MSRCLLNRQTSDFPNDAFIMKVLYGRTDVYFTLQDIYNNFSVVTTTCVMGNLIIGKDIKKVGVFTDPQNFIFPVDSGKIQSIPYSMASNYFPQGYIIKQGYPDLKTLTVDVSTATLNGSTFCKTCDGQMLIPKMFKQLFDENVWYFLRLEARDSHFVFLILGYLNMYDPNFNTGTFQLVSVGTQYPGKDFDYELIDDSTSVMSFDDHQTYLSLTVQTTVNIGGSPTALLIQGQMNYS